MSDSTPGVNVAARQRLDAPDGFVAGVDVDAGRLVARSSRRSSSEIQLADERLHQRAARRARPAIPSRCGGRARRTAPCRDLPRACRSLRRAARSRSSRSACFSSIVIISGVLRSATVASASATGARVGSRDGMPISNSASRRLGMAGDAERAKAGGGAAQQLLEAGVLVGELQRLDRDSSRATRS